MNEFNSTAPAGTPQIGDEDFEPGPVDVDAIPDDMPL